VPTGVRFVFMSTPIAPGLIHAFVLDGQGGGRALSGWEAVKAWRPDDGVLWLNLDYTVTEASKWLEEGSDLDPLLRDALLDLDPRPRATLHATDDLVFVIRGINVNRGAEPEDMISIRVHADRRRVITMRHRLSRSIKALATDIREGRGPKDAGDVVVHLGDHIVDGIIARVDALGDVVAQLEDQVLAGARKSDLRSRIADHRRRAIALRRFLAPQREALGKLGGLALPWFGKRHREQIAEVADRMTRSIEELDAARDRASVTQEELSSQVAELTNQRLYVLSIITAVFLPLGFVCALLGVNVGGIPFQHDDWAFWALCGTFVVGVVIQLWLFRRRGWM